MCVEVRNISNQDVSLIAVRDQAHNTLNLSLATNRKVVEIRMDLEDIPIPDMIHFHKQTGDIFFTNFLKSTLNFSKLKVTKSKIENPLRQEKVENRAHQAQIKKLQEDLLVARGQIDKGEIMKKLLDEKENAIQLLKNMLKIPATQLIEGPELAEIEKEKRRTEE